MTIIKTKVGDFKLTLRPQHELDVLDALGSTSCAGCHFYTPESDKYPVGACVFYQLTQTHRECSQGNKEYIYEEVANIFSVRQ